MGELGHLDVELAEGVFRLLQQQRDKLEQAIKVADDFKASAGKPRPAVAEKMDEAELAKQVENDEKELADLEKQVSTCPAVAAPSDLRGQAVARARALAQRGAGAKVQQHPQSACGRAPGFAHMQADGAQPRPTRLMPPPPARSGRNDGAD